ncbi:hypothetical protein TWF730_007309 [Orbilia blumenaviensis]|uniref:Guanine deaminase n=1 Tax=Orbilia blumenaviensis TaxID=1796055 RepID=A0AAV9V843_9PEZI
MFGFGIRNLIPSSKTVISCCPNVAWPRSTSFSRKNITMAASSWKYKVVNTPTIYVGTFIHSTRDEASKLDVCEEGAIGVNSDGVIEFVEREAKDVDSIVDKYPNFKNADVVQTKPGKAQFFFPGFIDTHIHAPQYPNAGVFGSSTLLDWLNKYTFPREASLSSLSVARTIYSRCVARTLSHGTTTAAYYATIHVPATNLLADICSAAGQRAFVGRVCMDHKDINPDYYRDESADESIANTCLCIDHIKNIDPNYELVSPIITPRFAPSCTAEALHKLGKLAKETGLPCQTHISENRNEVQLVKHLFPEYDSYAEVYDAFGLLTPKMILAHAIHLSKKEMELIKNRDAKVSHCPVSNSALTSGGAKVRWLLDGGVTVGLGTDVSGGYSPSVLEAVRATTLVSRHVALSDGDECKLSVEESLYLATRGGAKVVGLENKIGGFEVGMEWDAQLIGLELVETGNDEFPEDEVVDKSVFEGPKSAGPVDLFGWESWDEKVAKWVYNGDDRNTLAVWVKGRRVWSRT